MKGLLQGAIASLILWGSFVHTSNALIVQVDPATLSGTELIDFEDLGLTDFETRNYDGIFESGNALFGERFVGQTLTTSGDFDILSGSPTGPLAIATGVQNQNVSAIDGGAGDVGNTALAGNGPLEYPAYNAIGEGAIAVLYDFDQGEFGFDLIGADSGTAFVQFWARDGSLIDEIVLNLGTAIISSFGFRTDDLSDIVAGVSIYNNDPAGIGIDNLISNVPGVPGPPTTVPEPGTLMLLALGLLALGFARRRVRSIR